MKSAITADKQTDSKTRARWPAAFIGFGFILHCLLLLTLAWASAAHAHSNIPTKQPTQPKNIQNLNGIWEFAQTTQQHITQHGFTQLHWSSVQVPSILKTQPNNGMVGIYKTSFDYEQSQMYPVLFISNIRHADRVWINNEEIGGLGEMEHPWQFNKNNPQNLARIYDIPPHILRSKNNSLTIQTPLGFGDAVAAIYPGGIGITKGEVLIGNKKDINKKYAHVNTKRIAIDVVFCILGLIDVILISFLLRYTLDKFPDFIWLIISSLMMALASGAQDLFYVFDLAPLGNNAVLASILMLFPTANAIFFWSSRHDISKHIVTFSATISILLTLAVITNHNHLNIKRLCWFAYIGSSIVFYAYSIYAASSNLIHKKTGSTIQFIGLFFYLISIRSQWLPDGLFDHRNIQIGTMIFRYSLFISYVMKIIEVQKEYKKSVKKVLDIDKKTRSNIAMELHDGVIQRLATIRLLGQLIEQKEVSKSKHIASLKNETDAAIKSIRSAIQGYHDESFDKYSLTDILEQDAQRIKTAYGATLISSIDHAAYTSHTPAEHWMHIYRIIYECLINAIKHGGASKIEVACKKHENTLVVTIENNGKPFDANDTQSDSSFGSGNGWIAIRERTHILNAHIKIKNKKNSIVELKYPIPTQSKYL